MTFTATFDQKQQALGCAGSAADAMLERFTAEVAFARELAQAHPEQQAAWEALILQAMDSVQQRLNTGVGAEEAVKMGEAILVPLAATAKTYTIHCVGHAHIDMDWMWNWPETVSTVNDTFTTVDRLLQEFPTFKFSQSQVSIYKICKDYLPELYARIKQYVADGRWEITASQWVEGEKNLASGEILCRHLLYSRRFFQEEFGLPYDAVKIDWEPDTFGHPLSLPTLLTSAGVRHYYMHRGGCRHKLFWWEGKDGARLLVFDDWTRSYNEKVNTRITRELFDFERATGLRDFLFVYGVGDHGGGPTRRDLRAALTMDQWPIYPHILLSTTNAFFTIAETQAKDLPVVTDELNFTLEGCYTSQSNIKLANRLSENMLVEAEIVALLGNGLLGMPYPAEKLTLAWQRAMFNQFHDILPGSGVRDTYHHAQGQFQEILAETGMIKTRTLRAIAAEIDTTTVCGCDGACTPAEEPGAALAEGFGAGPGDSSASGAVSLWSAGSACGDPQIIFNTLPWTRDGLITTRIWDREYADGDIAVRDDAGRIVPAQVLGHSGYWGNHTFIEVAFPAREVEGFGYRSFAVVRSLTAETPSGGCSGNGNGIIENEFYRVEVEGNTGAIIQLLEKASGRDLIPAGGRFGLLEYLLEAPHPLTAWIFGQVVKTEPLANGTIDCPHCGPYLASVRAHHTLHDSTFSLTVSLTAGSPRIDFALDMHWLERGSPQIGVPALKIAFPLAAENLVASYEIPNGSIERSTNPADLPAQTNIYLGHPHYFPKTALIDRHPGEVPSQKWADLRGEQDGTPVGFTLLNDSKYGHSVKDGVLRLSLVRSSYDPDPLPEMGQQQIRFAVVPHVGDWSISAATRWGYDFNLPLNVVGTTCHTGERSTTAGFAEMLTPNIMLSGMKQAEDGEALIIRLYEMEGKATRARMRFAPSLLAPNTPAVQTDTLEAPLATNTAAMLDDVLEVDIPAHGLVTVRVG